MFRIIKLKQTTPAERRGSILKILARKWLKAPHNRFKMRRRRNGLKSEKEKQVTATSYDKQLTGRELTKTTSIITSRSHHTKKPSRKGKSIFDSCHRKLRQNAPPTIKLKKSLMSLLSISVLLASLVFVQATKTTSHVASQEPHSSSTAEPTLRPKVPSGSSILSLGVSPTTSTSAVKTTQTTAPFRLSTAKHNHTSPTHTTEPASSGPGGKLGPRLEEEVSLITTTSGDFSSTISSATDRAWRRQTRAHQNRPHRFIRVQATLNGKLLEPVSVESGSSLSSNAQLAMADNDQQKQQQPEGEAEPQWRPVTTNTPTSTTLSPDNATLTTTTTNSLTGDSGEPCQHPAETEVQHASIATSSQMLRLTTAKGNRTLAQQLLSSAAHANTSGGELDPTGQPVELNSHHSQLQQQGSTMQLAALTTGRASSAQRQAPTARIGKNLLNAPDQQVVAGGDSILSLIDDYDSKIITNRTKAQLSCDSGEMVLRLNFSDSFKGIVYPDHNRLSPCRFFGDGHHNYELRLPLRGCGTRQAAPRVFVNDVIVRFHKTLELEEDEVKTLICRYPPPLAPDPLPDGPTLNPAVIGNRQPTTSMTELPNSVLEQEGPAQFEFVDSLSGRPKLPELQGNSGNIETLSENLIVAPASGQQQTHLPHSQQPTTSDHESAYGVGGLGPRPGLRQREQPTDLLNSRNSLLLEPTSINGQNHAPSNFLERFSSIELLFLISSLMFLVLLVVGLGTSYYCFRRHAHRGSMQRASAILKRKRRYVGPGALLHHDNSASPAARGTGHPGQAALQQYYSQRVSGNGGQHRRPSLTSPSSPESDLSARGLLAPGGGHMASSYRGHHYHPSYNQAFVPDAALAKHYAARPYVSASYNMEQLAPGRRQRASSIQQQIPSNTGPVLGRRETIYHRPQRYLSPPVFSRPRQPTQFSSPFGQGQPKAGLNLSRLEQPMSFRMHNGTMMDSSQNHLSNSDYDHMPGFAGHLSRAKSLSSVRYLDPIKVAGLPKRLDQFVGGTEARGRRKRQRLPDGTEFPGAGSHRSAIRKPLRNFNATKEYSSDSEVEPNNNNLIGGGSNPATQRPSILLKSIEDSYITNFTEIYEQEYIKQDSTKPLTMNQWRAMQPSVQRPKRSNEDTKERDENLNDLDESNEDDRETIESNQEEAEQKYHSTHTNLRSLTELDVNFAKSLLLPSIGSLRPATSADQLANKANLTSEEQATSSSDVDAGSETPLTKPKVRATISEPRLAADLDQKVKLELNDDNWKSKQQQQNSPDLILSPDYDHDRLELNNSQSNSSSSHNTISYV